MRREWLALLAALQFLTRVPLPAGLFADGPAAREALRRGVAYFPLVGAFVGLFTACVALAAARLWPPGVAVALALAAEALVTGAFHEDAVADFCDAFGGGWTRDDVLRILRDSRVGSYGALGLGLALLLRWTATAALPFDATFIATIVAASAFGRGLVLAVMATVPPVADREGLAKDVAAVPSAGVLVTGTLWLALALGPLAWLRPGAVLGALLFGVVFVCWFGRLLRRRIGGVTGDCLGFACYTGQLGVLLASAAGVRS